MKRDLLKFNAVAVMAVLSMALYAAPASANCMMGKDSSEKYANHLTKELGLTGEQSSKVKTITDDTMAKMTALYTEKEARINAILTPEQRTKYAAEMKEWKEKRENDKDEDEDKDEQKQ